MPSQSFLTWPEGNAKLVKHLASKIKDKIQTGKAVLSIAKTMESETTSDVLVLDSLTNAIVGYRAKKVIFAGPQFVARHVVAGYHESRSDAISAFSYAPWLVANVYVSDLPKSPGFPIAWDNVIYESRGLGYVVATHQSGADHGPSVLTYYLPLCDSEPSLVRNWLEKLSWNESSQLVLSDLEIAHPDIRLLVDRIDVMHWGHAMIRPTPGFIHGIGRKTCTQPFHNVHFANTDLSGVALFEEAFYHGVRAATEVRHAINPTLARSVNDQIHTESKTEVHRKIEHNS